VIVALGLGCFAAGLLTATSHLELKFITL